MGYYRKVSKFEMIKFILEHELWDGTKSKSSLNKKKWAELNDICDRLMHEDFLNKRTAMVGVFSKKYGKCSVIAEDLSGTTPRDILFLVPFAEQALHSETVMFKKENIKDRINKPFSEIKPLDELYQMWRNRELILMCD